MSAPHGLRGPRRAAAPLQVRLSRASDREALAAFGHSPGVAQAFSPSPGRRLAWRLQGIRAVGVLAEDRGGAVGTVQFVRSSGDPGTWMFGHWRVAPARRREGIGRLLLSEGSRLLPGIRRLYSYVDWGNEVSVLAHERLGFEACLLARGSALLGALSTVGPTAPALGFEPRGRRDWPGLFDLYCKACGPTWVSLFPRLGSAAYLDRAGGPGRWPPGPTRRFLPSVRVWSVEEQVGTAAMVVRRGASLTLYADPARCDAALLARVALRLLAEGARRDQEISLVGLPRGLVARPGPVRVEILMGLPEISTLRDARRRSAP